MHNNKIGRHKQKCKICSSKLKLNTKYLRFVLRVCSFFIILLHCATKSQKEQNGTEKNVKLFLLCEFKCYISFEVSIPVPHTQLHTINRQFKCNRSRTLLFKIRMHQGMAASAIMATVPPPAYLQFFVGSLGEFSSQRVQTLFDGAVH